VVDSGFAFCNGGIVRAGPLRESVRQGLARADAVVLMGHGNPSLCGFAGTVWRAELIADRRLDGRRVVAFAGIGRPQKFFDTLNAIGAQIAECRSFGDHHVYSRTELAELRDRANRERATLITTEKDFVRLNPDEREDIELLRVGAAFEDPVALRQHLDTLFARVSSAA
jgi:tetraacyldisaccharide 4'-kinase